MIDVAHLLVFAANPMDAQEVNVGREAISALSAVLAVQGRASEVGLSVARTFLGIGIMVHFFRAAGDGSFFRSVPMIVAQLAATLFMIENFGMVVDFARTTGDQMAQAMLTQADYAAYWQSMGSYAGKIAEFSREAAGGGATGAVAAAVGWFSGGWSTVLLYLSYLIAMIASWIVGFGRELFLAVITVVGPLALSLTLLGVFNTLGAIAQMLATAALWKVIGAAMWRLNIETTIDLLGVVPSVDSNIKLIVLNIFFAFMTILACTIGSMLISGRLANVAGLALTAAAGKVMLAGGAAAGGAAARGITAGGKGVEGAVQAGKAAYGEAATVAGYIPPRPPDGWGAYGKAGTATEGMKSPWYTPDGWGARRRGLDAERAGNDQIMPGTVVSDRQLMDLRKGEQAKESAASPEARRMPAEYPESPRSASIDSALSKNDWASLGLEDRKRLMEGKDVKFGGMLGKTVTKDSATDGDMKRMTPEQRGDVARGGSVQLPMSADDFRENWTGIKDEIYGDKKGKA